MKKYSIFIFAFLFLIQIGFSITLQNITLQSTNSNTSISSTEAINTTQIIFDDDYIYLGDFQFNESKSFWLNGSTFINHSDTFDLNFSAANATISFKR